MMATSVTDQASYRAFCARAAGDDSMFATFRRDPILVRTLEHVSPAQAFDYLEVVRAQSPELLDRRARTMINDRAGGPILADIQGFGPIAPTTLRYLKVLSDLEVHFGPLDGRRIAEIGVGYGGQARLILDRFTVERYILLDLPECLSLARRYLETLAIDGFETALLEDLGDYETFDLVISNYAFTECARPIQDLYARRVLHRSQAGYVTCNFVSAAHGVDSYSRDELLQLHHGARFEAEVPLTHADNVILVWGDEARRGQGPADPG